MVWTHRPTLEEIGC